MRAEAISWNDYSVSNPPPIVEDDKWHVEFEPNEVRVVSLEQLDDLFRLSIVDSETKVWQAGMSDWQPLRVIAGLDEQPASAVQRTHSMPPPPALLRTQPMPAKPPKPPMRSASPSVRPAPPAPHSMTPSVRPAPPAARSSMAPSVRPAPPAARPAYIAPASFYPEPIQSASSAYPPAVQYAAPIAFAATMPATSSVRPLVVSQAPPMARGGGGGFGRFLVGLSLLAGVSVTAYRNDFLRDGAHAAHQDALYARLESALGGPAFGTVRALEPSTAAAAAFEGSASNEAAVRTAIPAVTPPVTPSTAAPALGTITPPVVSLESLTTEKKGQPAAAPVAPVAAAPATPVRAVASFVQPKPAAKAAPAAAKAAPARAAATPKAVVEKPAAPQKPASEMSERERLNAAIGQSMMQADAPKSKAKAKAKANNDYDPLNPNL